ncbi:MAG: transposase [Thalassovita sp.]
MTRRGSLSVWFEPEMVWTLPPSGKSGQRSQFSEAAIQTCLATKVLFEGVKCKRGLVGLFSSFMSFLLVQG